jgi:hypothetical protein
VSGLVWAFNRRVWPFSGAHRAAEIPLAIFCYQVFFDYDPSSAASLLSSVGITTKAQPQDDK